jgi:hypothetical protein
MNRSLTLMAPNKSLQRSGTHKVLARGPALTLSAGVALARSYRSAYGRGTQPLGDLFALTTPPCSETMFAWNSTSLAT